MGSKEVHGQDLYGHHQNHFLIDEAGMVQHIIEKPDTKDHTAEILAISGW
jgi:peroxiredoxin Q/BCP